MTVSITRIAQSLHPLERKVLPCIATDTSIAEIVEKTSLQEVEVMRAVQWLQNKKLITIDESSKDYVELGTNGIRYAEEGLPEKRFLKTLATNNTLPLKKMIELADLSQQEVTVCIGVLRRKAAIDIEKEDGLSFTITEQGRKLANASFLEEKFLRKPFPVDLSSLSPEENFALGELKKRKDIVQFMTKKEQKISLTAEGEQVASSEALTVDVIERITPDVLKSWEWQHKSFRRYDVSINVPKRVGAKKQPYRWFLDDVRQKLIGLGFSEMTGPIVESDFWDMDALYMPQFHSARDIHDAYYIKEPKHATDIPKEILDKVKAAHENGFDTGSTGWQYSFDVERTKRQLLRTQTTACSARMLGSGKTKIPGRYFAMARCFRYDVIDATHLSDFTQVEGFIAEEGLNLRHLFGILELFAKDFAQADEIKIIPGYFPFTEPSATLYAKHAELGWIEFGGAGIFRPEMLRPLGINVPVIAWGMGIDRIAMFRLGITDIRELFSHNLAMLRNAKVHI